MLADITYKISMFNIYNNSHINITTKLQLMRTFIYRRINSQPEQQPYYTVLYQLSENKREWIMCKDENNNPIINYPFETNIVTTYFGINDSGSSKKSIQTLINASDDEIQKYIDQVKFKKLNLTSDYKLIEQMPICINNKKTKPANMIIDNRHCCYKTLSITSLNEIMLDY